VSNTAAKPVAAAPPKDGRISLGPAAELALGAQLKVSVPGFDDPVLVARVAEDDVRAVSISCTHWGSDVVLVLDEKKFRCDAHGSEFGFDGKVLEGPASDPLPSFEVVEEGGELFLIPPAGAS
jgi:cytochrome b6-f complex iron-sulfur subunit